MRPLFQHTEHETQYADKGYIIYPLLTPDEIEQLLNVYQNLNSGLEGSTFYTSHSSGNVEYKEKVDAAIRAVLEPKLNDIFKDYRPVFAFYLVKTQGSETLELHLDWQFVDERQYVGFNMWCPLVDVTKDNGAVFVLPGSHKQIKVLRGYNTPNPVHFVEQPVNEKLFKTIDLKAGEAMIFDLRLLHGAWPNAMPQPRIAIGMAVIPQEAELLHFFADKELREETRVEVYRMQPQDYMHNHAPTRPPAERMIGVWEDEYREETIRNIQANYSVRTSWLSRLFS